MNNSKYRVKAFTFVGTLFFLFGGITVLIQFLLPYLRDIFELDYTHSALLLFFFFLPYLLLSIPAGFILSRIGYQRGIVLGLVLIALGALLFHPAADERSFPLYMFAVFVIGSGITFLQVALHPYISALGSQSTTPSRLTYSQAFNALGTTFAPIAASVYLLNEEVKNSAEIAQMEEIDRQIYLHSEALSIQIPSLYIALVVIVLALVFSLTKLPYANTAIEKIDKKSYFTLLRTPSLLLGAIGIFLYVGAEVIIGSFTVNYLVENNTAEISECPVGGGLWNNITEFFGTSASLPANPKAIVGIFLCTYWGGAMVGRFIGARLTRCFSPSKMLMIAGASNIILILLSINTNGLFSMITLLSLGLFNSIMFPTIFALANEGIDELQTQASALLCTMIVGGGLVPIAYGFLTDYVGFRLAFLVLVACYGYIVFYGFYKSNR